MAPLLAATVADRLGYEPGSVGRRMVERLSAVPDEAVTPLEPFDRAAAAGLLGWLGVGSDDAKEVLATLPDPRRTPERWWLLERQVSHLVATMGEPDRPRGIWPAAEGPSVPVEQRCHFVHVALAVVPHTVAYLAAEGVADEVVRASLGDLARHLAIHRRVHGVTGVDASWWVTLCLRGELVELGRLQYNRFRLGESDSTPLVWYDEAEQERRGEGFRRHDDCLGVHIPEGGPLDEALVADSLGAAGDFFSSHFTTARRRVATCMSWLLDEQLADLLPSSSGIRAFARRFELVPGGYDGDGDVLQFVFRRGRGVDLGTLPQTTTLERAVVAHLGGGGHFTVRTGWLDLPG